MAISSPKVEMFAFSTPDQSESIHQELLAIEEVYRQRQGQVAARNILGKRQPFTSAPFFWSVHYDVTISYIGHAPGYDSVEVFGSIDANDAAVAFRKNGKTLAVATLNRDKLSLSVDAAMARNDLPGVDAVLPVSRRSSLGFM